jgi:murein DD-endopeptidase MepM/ murein hydrolase activator NlpD
MNSESQENKRNLQERLSEKYRMVILDDDTLGEIKTVRFSIIGLLSILFASIFLVCATTYCLISFTPLRYLVPGYADIENNKVYMELNEKLNQLEKELEAQKIYTDGIKNFLNPSGRKFNIDEAESGMTMEDEEYYSSINNVGLKDFYMIPPLKGSVSAPFNLEKNHLGVDLVAPKNTPVKNILDGVVISADWSYKTGNTISIQHKNDILSVFKHNSKLLKKQGDTVKKGEAVAIIGNTGELSSGPHVHFELWNQGIPVNPENYIRFN